MSDEGMKEKIIDIAPSFFMDRLIELNKKSKKNNKRFIHNISGSDPSLAINQIFSHESEEEKKKTGSKTDFLMLGNEQISSLVPLIRIFKTYHEPNGIVEIELPFEDYSNSDNFENIFNNKVGRGGGYGITSFEWNSMAKNEASIAQYSARLKIHVQDVTELDKVRNYKKTETGNYTVSLIDLIYPNIREAENLGNFTYDRKKLAIKMTVGWKNDEIAGVNEYGTSNLSLTLIKHGFDFKDDGSLDIEIEYVASLEMDLRDDILNNTIFSTQEKLFNSINNIIKSIDYRLEKIEDENTEETGFFDWLYASINSAEKSRLNRLEEEKLGIFYSTKGFADALDEQVAVAKAMFKNEPRYFPFFEKVSKRLTEMTDVRKFVGGTADDKIEKIVEVLETSREDLNNLIEEVSKDKLQEILQDLRTEDRLRYYLIGEESYDNLKKIIDGGQSSELSQIKFDNLKKEIQTAKKNAEESQQFLEGSMNYLADVKEDVRQVTTNTEQEEIDTQEIVQNLEEKLIIGDTAPIICFTSLNDILEIMLSGCEMFKDNNKLILGEFTYKDYDSYDPNAKFKVSKLATGEEKINRVVKLEERKANIGDIPITLKSFINWYSSNITNKDVKKLSPMNLISSIFNSLIPANIKNNHVKFLPSYKVQHTTKFSLMDKEIYDERIAKLTHLGLHPFIFASAIQKSKKRSLLGRPKKYVNCIFLLSRDEEITFGNGNFKEDWEKNNIFHFLVGEEKGLMKSVKFSRDDNPRLETVNITAANPENNSGFVRQVYNSEITLFGNNLFEPGGVVFISPTYPGVGITNDVMFRIGLGGYYRIIDVNNTVDSDGFETVLKCRWDSFGKIIVPGNKKVFKKSELTEQQQSEASKADVILE